MWRRELRSVPRRGAVAVKWVYDLQWRWKRRGCSPWNQVVNRLCLSADYCWMGLDPKPERICYCPRLSNCEHNSSQTALAPNQWDVLASKQPPVYEAACLILPGSFVVKMTPVSSVCVSRLVEGCEYTAGSVGMKVTGNGDFCQVFPVLLDDWDSQAQACLLLFSLGTKAVMLGCQSTWLLSLGTVPISLICLLFPS